MIDTRDVTEAQIDRCHRIENGQTGEVFYIVESERDSRIEYKVSAFLKDGAYHFACTCPAGLHGVPCKHCRWVKAAADEYKAWLAALAERQAREAASAPSYRPARMSLILNGKPATEEEYERVMHAKPRKGPRPQAPDDCKPFSILR